VTESRILLFRIRIALSHKEEDIIYESTPT